MKSQVKTKPIAAPYRTVQARYGQMTVFANDTGAVSRSLAEYGEWAENELAFMRKLVPPGATVIDVGAYVGTHTLAFSHFVGPEGRVVAIEPQPETFEVLTKNIANNPLGNVTLHHAAMGASAGTIEMRPIEPERQASFGSASLLAPETISAEVALDSGQSLSSTVTIGVMTIDSLELSSCSLIKIDAEGFEELVLRGAAETTRRFAPAIYAECNSVENGLKTAEILRELDYSVRMHIVDVFNRANYLRKDSDVFGGAREVALVGLRGELLDLVDGMTPEACELILKIDSADDLALGMLNKPQYPVEILSKGAAAGSGGAAWLEGLRQLRIDFGRIENELIWAKGELEKVQERADATEVERQRVVNELGWAKGELEKSRAQAHRDAVALTAQIDAAMQQARFAREALDRAEIADAKRERRMGAMTIEFEREFERKSAALNEEFERRIGALTGEFERRIAALNGQLASIYRSRSWRITVPLRIGTEFLRRIRRRGMQTPTQ